MNCQEFQESLERSVDERRPLRSPDAAVDNLIDDHVAECSQCAKLLEQHLLLEAALTEWKPRKRSIDLGDRVLTAVLADRDGTAGTAGGDEPKPAVSPSVEVSPRANFWPTVVTVALVLLAVAVVFRDRPNQVADDRTKDSPTESPLFPREPEEKLDDQEQLADLSHLIADAQSAWYGIASRASSRASGLSVFVPDLDSGLGITDVSLPLASPTEETPDTPQEASGSSSESSEPSAVEKTFHFLFDQATPAGTRTI